MKKIIQAISFLGLALVLGGVAANAQSATTKVDANVPFDFVVNDRSFAAGIYTLRISHSAGASIMEVRDKSGDIVHVTLLSTTGQRRQGTSELVFERAEGRNLLARIVTADAGYSVPQVSVAKQVAVSPKADGAANN